MTYKVRFEILLFVEGVPRKGDSVLVVRDVEMPFVPFPGMGIILCCDDCGEWIVNSGDIIWDTPRGIFRVDLRDEYRSVEEMCQVAEHLIQCGWRRENRQWVDGQGNVVGEE